jgi:hypothetical protein
METARNVRLIFLNLRLEMAKTKVMTLPAEAGRALSAKAAQLKAWCARARG